ncbi:MAG TPA: 30S ribosomal protein S12 methylthiotransferase RimO [Gemmatimonadaceae bacterium]|nr:30S ribosomal protein S12 methylthiotransferase RimO [Gemmatimonadaceae bacterium]
MKIGLITLGCDKNTVDSERYLAQLVGHGAELAESLEEADVILVNTCGFIDAAKQESIDALIEAGRMKIEGACQAVVAVGCMVERHKNELLAELPEVDLFLGSSEMRQLVPALEARGLVGGEVVDHPGVRIYAGNLPHVRYLKISEGCDHGCAFCAIPLMRGRHRSFSLEEIVREAQLLEAQGARELNLVAQDLAHYGRDRRDGVRLPELLQSLLAETSIPWLRMLYLYSAGLTPRLLEVMAREPRLVPYLDIPIQHASDTVLARMRRPERARTIREKVSRVREVVPDVAIRTTCIVGFPGETPDDFARLVDFLEDVRFERVGAFTYSAQEGTRAAELEDDVPEEVKLERLERLTELQRSITAERYERHIGRTVRAIVDRAGEGRTLWQADDVDGITHLIGDAPSGTMVDVRLDEVVDDYDFRATVVRAHDVPRPATARSTKRNRKLPVMIGISDGSFGR